MRLSGDYISDSEGGGQIITIDYRGCPEARNWIFLRLDLVSAAKSWSWSSLGRNLDHNPHDFHGFLCDNGSDGDGDGDGDVDGDGDGDVGAVFGNQECLGPVS